MLDSHETFFHNGVDITLNFFQATYWIIKGRQTVKKKIKKCATCKLVHGKTVIHKKEPVIPSFGVEHTYYPFGTVGIDHTVPMFQQIYK